MLFRFPAPSLRRAIPAVAAVLLAAGTASTSAHHTFVTKYDNAKQLTIAGVVANVRYGNPHIFFDVSAKNGASWTVETEGILAARAKGLTEALLKDGAPVTVTGWASRDKTAELGLKSITFAGGRTVTMRNTAR